MAMPIYMDYAASTPVAKEVAEAMCDCLTIEGNFGNPASRSHFFGWKAEEAVEIARKTLAECIDADPREIVWTSGATESSNLAIKGCVELWRSSNREAPHIICSSIEHKSVLDTFAYLEDQGVDVSYIDAEQSGDIGIEKIMRAVKENTVLISIMHANNETGIVNNVQEIGRYCRERDILFHIDAAQTLGKRAISVRDMHVDLMSMSAHKLYGPKGVGALFVRRQPRPVINAQMHGGGHERNMRSGTLATHQIVGFGKAIELCGGFKEQEKMRKENARIVKLRRQFLSVASHLPGFFQNGVSDDCLPGILNIGFDGVDGETLLMSLRELAISSGSACTSASMEPSYVLKNMGVCDERSHNSLRFSFGRYTTEKNIDTASALLSHAVKSLSR